MDVLPEVGDLQRSSEVAEPSLMSHRPVERERETHSFTLHCAYVKR